MFFCELSLELAEIVGAVDSRPNIYFYVDLVTGDVFLALMNPLIYLQIVISNATPISLEQLTEKSLSNSWIITSSRSNTFPGSLQLTL